MVVILSPPPGDLRHHLESCPQVAQSHVRSQPLPALIQSCVAVCLASGHSVPWRCSEPPPSPWWWWRQEDEPWRSATERDGPYDKHLLGVSREAQMSCWNKGKIGVIEMQHGMKLIMVCWVISSEVDYTLASDSNHQDIWLELEWVWSFHEKMKAMIGAYIDGLVQDCSNSIANALELLQSCTEPSTCG